MKLGQPKEQCQIMVGDFEGYLNIDEELKYEKDPERLEIIKIWKEIIDSMPDKKEFQRILKGYLEEKDRLTEKIDSLDEKLTAKEKKISRALHIFQERRKF